MKVDFQLASNSDIELLMDFQRGFHQFFHETFDEAVTRQAILTLIADPSLGRIWLIKAENQPAGYVVLCFGYSLEYGGRDAFIDELFLAADYRNRGIGEETLKFVERVCPEWKVRALHLEVEKDNSPAHHLYQKFGFKDNNRYLMTKRYY